MAWMPKSVFVQDVRYNAMAWMPKSVFVRMYGITRWHGRQRAYLPADKMRGCFISGLKSHMTHFGVNVKVQKLVKVTLKKPIDCDVF